MRLLPRLSVILTVAVLVAGCGPGPSSSGGPSTRPHVDMLLPEIRKMHEKMRRLSAEMVRDIKDNNIDCGQESQKIRDTSEELKSLRAKIRRELPRLEGGSAT